MTEQVSHHPPITAICFEAAYAKLIANSDMGLSFNGKGIDVVLRQNPIIFLMNEDKGFNEKYSYEFGRNSAVNLIWGQMMFTHSGTVHVYQEESGAYAKCKINHCQGLFMKDKDKCKLHAEIFAAGSDDPAYWLTGTWLSHIDV